MPSHRFRTSLVALLAVGVAFALSACGTAPWDQPQFRHGTAAAAPSASRVPRARPTPTITAVRNDLAEGSARHHIHAGDLVLTVTYWSTLSMARWTPGADKPISLSASARSKGDPGADVYLARASLDIAVTGRHGALPGPAQQLDRATVKPGYDIRPPYTYGQSYVVSAVSPQATALTFTFTYTLLEETTPTSDRYAKQTAVDSLTVALAR